MNDKQYITFSIDGHDANVCAYSSKTNKFLHLELERIFGKRYFSLDDFLKTDDKVYILSYIKSILIDYGFEEKFELASLIRSTDTKGLGGTEKNINLIKSVFDISEFVFFNHHECHAANAFYSSKFESALIFSFDGFGNDGNLCVFSADKNKLTQINPYTLTVMTELYAYTGNYISEIKKNENPYINQIANSGKIMGLSAYGNLDTGMYNSLYNFLKNNFYGNDLVEKYKPFLFRQDHLKKIIGGNFEEFSNQQSANLAYNMQLAFENTFIEYFQNYFDPKIHKNVCLSGGGALNVLLNDRLAKIYPSTNFYVSSSPNDCGLSYGAMCLLTNSSVVEETMYSGCPLLDEEILPHILMYRSWKSTDIKKIALDLYNGKIIGLCRGQSEVGPRALGNRSILANPCNHNMKDIINKRIKFREWFRPFAPICCEDDVSKFFNTNKNVNYKYMTFSPTVIESCRKLLPAITHIDGSSRLQTINYNQNPYLYESLKEFEKLSGFPILINTSFNIKGKPILTHYQAAIQNLDTVDLDGLILDEYYITK